MTRPNVVDMVTGAPDPRATACPHADDRRVSLPAHSGADQMSLRREDKCRQRTVSSSVHGESTIHPPTSTFIKTKTRKKHSHTSLLHPNATTPTSPSRPLQQPARTRTSRPARREVPVGPEGPVRCWGPSSQMRPCADRRADGQTGLVVAPNRAAAGAQVQCPGTLLAGPSMMVRQERH